jgi:hypothetical protein
MRVGALLTGPSDSGSLPPSMHFKTKQEAPEPGRLRLDSTARHGVRWLLPVGSMPAVVSQTGSRPPPAGGGLFACWRGAMSRPEILFWTVAVAIVAFSGVVVVVTSHDRHHGGYTTPSVSQYSGSAVDRSAGFRRSREGPRSAMGEERDQGPRAHWLSGESLPILRHRARDG